MAALASTLPTLLDLAKRMDPDGKITSQIVEILNETNEMLDDMVWEEGNLPTGHKVTVRSGIPQPTWRRLNGGVQPGKSSTRQLTFNCGMLEAYAEIDKKLADLNGNTAAWRLSEERPFVEGFNQEIQDTAIYGNEGTEPEAFTGIMPYFNDLSAESADNVIDAGGTGADNQSILLVVWSSQTICGIVPKGSKAGIQMKDLGEVTIENIDGSGGRMQAYRTHYTWDAGLSVRDWRYVVRIANIDKSDLTRVYTNGAFSSGANLPDLMFQALRRIPSLRIGRPAFYMSRDIATWVARQSNAIGQTGMLQTTKVGGDERFTEAFNGVPMRRVDAMSANETRVV